MKLHTSGIFFAVLAVCVAAFKMVDSSDPELSGRTDDRAKGKVGTDGRRLNRAEASGTSVRGEVAADSARSATVPASGGVRMQGTAGPGVATQPSSKARRSDMGVQRIADHLGSRHTNGATSAGNHGLTVPWAPSQPVTPVRLADDFRLPAAIMHEASADSQDATTDPVRAANRQIIVNFYAELAASEHQTGALGAVQGAGESRVDGSGAPQPSEIIAVPGGPGERVRSKYDELFRALYGDSLYNGRLVAAAIERTLPVPAESSDTE